MQFKKLLKMEQSTRLLFYVEWLDLNDECLLNFTELVYVCINPVLYPCDKSKPCDFKIQVEGMIIL